ncbi:nucleotidyl transferase AbiEii/AbiGii toxin family protein [Patescibacteria group bacterium]|nr:nucleotidyl transferase AbiEii/AbiGii toxin family protein [Patescibacteria group bacterium]
MYKEILTDKQIELFPLLKKFSKDFYFAGGTAVALHIGHRHSIDLDLFSGEEFENKDLVQKVKSINSIDKVVIDKAGEYTLISQGVKITFLHYPYKVEHQEKLDDIIGLPDLITLAAMKAFTLGRRAKWKDYVDLYFVMENYCGLRDIADKANNIFDGEFNEKLFRVQLAYFEDVDYSEQVDYLSEYEVADDVVKERLKEISTS